MSLETKSLTELEELASNLRKQIARRPDHSRMERVELEDVQDWLTQRRKEAAGAPSTEIVSKPPLPNSLDTEAVVLTYSHGIRVVA